MLEMVYHDITQDAVDYGRVASIPDLMHLPYFNLCPILSNRFSINFCKPFAKSFYLFWLFFARSLPHKRFKQNVAWIVEFNPFKGFRLLTNRDGYWKLYLANSLIFVSKMKAKQKFLKTNSVRYHYKSILHPLWVGISNPLFKDHSRASLLLSA